MDELLTTAQASKILHVPESTLRWWRHRSVGPRSFTIGDRRVFYKLSDLTAWVDEAYTRTSRGRAV